MRTGFFMFCANAASAVSSGIKSGQDHPETAERRAEPTPVTTIIAITPDKPCVDRQDKQPPGQDTHDALHWLFSPEYFNEQLASVGIFSQRIKILDWLLAARHSAIFIAMDISGNRAGFATKLVNIILNLCHTSR